MIKVMLIVRRMFRYKPGWHLTVAIDSHNVEPTDYALYLDHKHQTERFDRIYEGANFLRGDESIPSACPVDDGITDEVVPIGYGRVTSQVLVDTTSDSTAGKIFEQVTGSRKSPTQTACGEALEDDFRSDESEDVVTSKDTVYTFVCAKRVESVRCISEETSQLCKQCLSR